MGIICGRYRQTSTTGMYGEAETTKEENNFSEINRSVSLFYRTNFVKSCK